MATELDMLVELQSLDQELTRHNALLAELPKKLAKIDLQLASARKRVEDAKAAIKATETGKRLHEQEIQTLNDKIAKFRGQSSSIKNNEQYKALLSEIAQAEAEIAKHEEKILEVMMGSDGLAETLKEAEAALKRESAEIEAQKKATEAEAESERTAAQAVEAQAAKLRTGVDETLLATYDRLRRSRGTAVAEVMEQRCSACQVMARPQAYARVKAREEVVHCDSCGRMLHYIPEHNVQKASASATGIAHQAEREWLFVPSLGTAGAFVVFINHKGTATMKAYDAVTGAAIAKRVEKNSLCRQIFADEMRDARNLFVDDATLEDTHKEQLPLEVLEDMRHQLPKP